jgi:hypothetical protein
MTMQAEPANGVAAYGRSQPRWLEGMSDFLADVWCGSRAQLSKVLTQPGTEDFSESQTSVHDAVLEAQAYVVSHGGFHYR